ncbi:MAG: elongation factor Ts [Dehalococcoidales bacterium]|nr:elongation factor Ts [Dehalococcoidales bacterium]
MNISTDLIKELREQSGAGIMDCRTALVESSGDREKALQALREKGLLKAKKTEHRVTGQGLVEAYVHPGGRIGAMVEIKCETDFVARTEEFKSLAHCVALQVAAMNPKYASKDDVPQGTEADIQAECLLEQVFIRDPNKTVRDIVTEVIAKTGENVRVTRFARFELGN